jgi:hypothetical protein
MKIAEMDLTETSIDVSEITNKNRLKIYNQLKELGYTNSSIEKDTYYHKELAFAMVTAFWIKADGLLEIKLYEFQTNPKGYNYIKIVD